MADMHLEYGKGLNLFDAPDMGEGLFIGRETESQDMESILQPHSHSPGSSRKVLIQGGMGGIGKTQLAITYAKRHRRSYTSIYWMNANTEATLKDTRSLENYDRCQSLSEVQPELSQTIR
jgi:hypothetical protein